MKSHPVPPRSSRPFPGFIPILALFLLYAVVYGYVFDEKINLNGDNMGYYASAKNIVQGKGFSYAYDIFATRLNEPIGYPLLIAATMLISDSMNFIALVNGVLLFLSILLLLGIAGSLGISRLIQGLTALYILLNPSLMQYAYIHMSEGPFIFFSLLAIFLFLKLKPGIPYTKQPLFYLMAFSLLAMYFTRTAGIILLIGFLLYLLYDKKYLAASVLAFLFFVSLGTWSLYAPASNRYVQQVLMVNPYDANLGKLTIKSGIQRFGTNLKRYAGKEVPSVVFPFLDPEPNKPAKWPHYLIGVGIAVLTLTGLWYKFPRDPQRLLIFLYLAGSLAMLLMWPSQWFGSRFITPLVPLILLFSMKGLQDFSSLIAKRAGMRTFSYMPCLALLAVPFFIGIKPSRYNIGTLRDAHKYAQSKYPPAYQNFFNLGKWAKTNLPAQSVVASRKPTLFYYTYQGPSCYYPTNSKTTVEFMNGLRESRAGYLVMEELGYKTTPYLSFFINNLPQHFQLLHTIPNPDTKIYRILYPQ